MYCFHEFFLQVTASRTTSEKVYYHALSQGNVDLQYFSHIVARDVLMNWKLFSTEIYTYGHPTCLLESERVLGHCKSSRMYQLYVSVFRLPVDTSVLLNLLVSILEESFDRRDRGFPRRESNQSVRAR